MTVMVDWQIKKAIRKHQIQIDPFNIQHINPNSIDVKLGSVFLSYGDSSEVLDPYDSSSIISNLEEVTREWINPGEFLLASTLETISLPDNIVASIEGKSSIARLGVELHQTGGWIDAGFCGQVTLEMCNVNTRPVRIYPGMLVGQLVFYKTKHAAIPYGMKASSKYQGQTGPVASRYNLNNKPSELYERRKDGNLCSDDESCERAAGQSIVFPDSESSSRERRRPYLGPGSLRPRT